MQNEIMLALNMAAVSVYRILNAKNSIVLEQEYNNIIDNLNISDKNLINFYVELLNMTARKTARINKKKPGFINLVLKSIPDFDSSVLQWFGSLAFAFISAYIDYQEHHDIDDDDDDNNKSDSIWHRDNEEDLMACSNLKAQLLETSLTLEHKYNLPVEKRMTEYKLRNFYRIISIADPQERLKKLTLFTEDFADFHPYWYFCVKTAYEIRLDDKILEYINKFNEIWRPVFIKDSYKLEITKYHILFLMKHNGIYRHKDKILHLLTVMENHNPKEQLESWSNNLFIGTVYFAAGKKQKALSYVKLNIERKYEIDLSKAVLLQISMGELEPARLHGIIASYKDLSAKIFNDDPENLYNLGCIYFAKHDYERSANFYRESALKEYPPAQFRLGTAYYLGLGISSNYKEAVHWYTKAAEHGLTKAQIVIGILYQSGIGVKQNFEIAYKWFAKSASAAPDSDISKVNEAESQYILGVKCFARREYNEAAKHYQAAAEYGHNAARIFLGLMHQFGLGITKSDEQAVFYIQDSVNLDKMKLSQKNKN